MSLERRTPLARGTSQLRRTRLKPMSDKRRAEIPERDRVREQVLRRDNYLCVAADLVPSVACWGHLDVDEIKPRSDGGDYLNPDDCQSICRAHHDWKHAHHKEALALGLWRR